MPSGASMTTIALIGSDGAGKSRLASELQHSFPYPVQVLYLGMNPESGRFALPSTRLSHLLKKRSAQRSISTTDTVSLHTIEHRKDHRGRTWATLRLVNRIAEAIVKQLVAWWYQVRGSVVIFDRHYLFDFTPSSDRPRRLTSRLHLTFLERLYPRPDMVIFLDAPPEVLLSRKQEVPASYLEARRVAFLRRGAEFCHFFVVDASRDFDTVCRDVIKLIEQHLTQQHKSRTT